MAAGVTAAPEKSIIPSMKRKLDEPPPPEAPPPTHAVAVPTEMPTGDAAVAEPAAAEGEVSAVTAPTVPSATDLGAEESSLQGEIAWLHQQNAALQQQLASLQQQHMTLTAAAAQARAQAPAPAQALQHNQAWSQQVDPSSGQTYYWNSQTGESTYARPHDFNPGAPGATASATTGLPQTKGPPGANLFVVRKMRRGEYDEFNDADLAREFGKFGNVTRAEMTIDKENGWSKGFGFVSFAYTPPRLRLLSACPLFFARAHCPPPPHSSTR